jgi:hypothetical protein
MKTMRHQTKAIPGLDNQDKLEDFRENFIRFLRPALLLTLLLVFVSAPRNPAQRSGGGSGSSMGSATQNPGGPPLMNQDPLYQGRNMPGGSGDPIMYERRMKALNAQRHKSMVDDTNKLLKLTTQLNEEVNGAHAKPLNSDQLRQVAEIEKLARSIRDKMCTTVGGTPLFNSPMPFPISGAMQ